MSIYAYVGLPRSGKTYSVVEHQILPALKAGRRIATNIPLKWDVVRAEFPDCDIVEVPTQKVQVEPASIYDYVTPGTILILDEVWRLFPAGLKANHVPEPFRKLLAEHGHMVDAQGNACQIVLVTQDLKQISAFARQLVETTFRTTKLTTVGLNGQYRVDVYTGPAEGPMPPRQQWQRDMFGHYREAVYRFYESHTMREDPTQSGKVNERSMDRRANILKRPIVAFGAVAVVVLLVGGVKGLTGAVERFKGKGKEPAGEAPVASSVPAVAAVAQNPDRPKERLAVAAVVERPAVVEPAGEYRIAAVIINHDDEARSRAIVTDGTVNVTIPYRDCYTTPDGRTFCDYRGQEIAQVALASYDVPPEAAARLQAAREYLNRQEAPRQASVPLAGSSGVSGTGVRRERHVSRIEAWRRQ